jgi:hypothetical protein
MYKPLLPLTLSLLIGALPAAQAQAPAPPVTANETPFTVRVSEYPSLWQRNPSAKLPGNGEKSCGPVSASNALMWLAEHGYRKLLPDPNVATDTAGEREAAQVSLVRALVAAPYIEMGESQETSARSVAEGVRRYIEAKGYEVERLEWRNVIEGGVPAPAPAPPAAKPNGLPPPTPRFFTMEEIKSAFRDGAVVWLGLGMMRSSENSPSGYQRFGGHAVTLVGFGTDEAGRKNPNMLIIHDPDRLDGSWPHYYVQLVPMEFSFRPRRDTPEASPTTPRPTMRRYRLVMRRDGDGDTTFVIETATILKLKPATQKP